MCPTTDELYLCENNLTTLIYDCVTTLKTKAESKKCQIRKVEVLTLILHRVSNRFSDSCQQKVEST